MHAHACKVPVRSHTHKANSGTPDQPSRGRALSGAAEQLAASIAATSTWRHAVIAALTMLQLRVLRMRVC